MYISTSLSLRFFFSLSFSLSIKRTIDPCDFRARNFSRAKIAVERSGARRRFAKKGGLKSRNADTYRKLYRGNQIFSKKKSLGFKSLLKETQEGEKRSHHPRVKKLLDFRLLLGKEKSALQKPTPKTKNCFLSQNRHFLKTRLKHRAKTPPLGYNVSKIRATAKGGGSVRAERAQAHRLFGTLFCSSFFVRVRTTTNPFLNSF